MGQEKEREFYSGTDSEARRVFRYYKLYHKAIQWLPEPDKCPTILDLGCGPGLFAAYLLERGYQSYVGVDFSAPLIRRAMVNAPDFSFICGDLRKAEIRGFIKSFKMVIALEFLEHVNDDLGIIGEIAKGTKVIASVPNYDSEGHVRFFSEVKHVVQRYCPLLNITQKTEVEGSMNEGKQNVIFVISGEKK
jgi:2-polyprenyl-3-methyl-5-hydroxy-6-metoxy-1,4-benzoquinol methylase